MGINFKSQKGPISLKASYNSGDPLCRQLISDLDHLNRFNDLFPDIVAENIYDDLRHLIENRLANRLAIRFYHSLNPNKVYFEKSYNYHLSAPNTNQDLKIECADLPEPYEFDVFVFFSKHFLALSPDVRKSIMQNFHYDWSDPSKMQQPVEEPVKKPQQPEIHPSYMPHDIEQEIPLAVHHSPVDNELLNHFNGTQSLFLAQYDNSRKLIEKFVLVAESLQLVPLQWTHSDGFRELTTNEEDVQSRSFSRDNYNPLETLQHIKDDPMEQTIYLLEDFHHYLGRENINSSHYAEMISLIKCLPERLAEVGSYVVILAPHAELPPEIAPILKIIRGDKEGTGNFYYLERFGQDLSKKVAERVGKKVIGRDREIMECFKILTKMEGNNPLLVGKAGVGKTAIIEGLAAQIQTGKVPTFFKSKRIFSLNLNSMLSGTKYRGEFEKRLEGLLEEVQKNAEHIIVFIDEIHTLLNMGATEGSAGAENTLKPALARGDFPCIGASTFEEYKRYIEPDKALARRFQVIHISEPSNKQTVQILKGVKSVYEQHHQVHISDSALTKCVEMSDQLIKDQYFPGKAIKMLDSVCAYAILSGHKTVTPDLVVHEFKHL